MHLVILGDGPMGRAIARAATDDGHRADVLGRPRHGRHPVAALQGADVVIDATRGEAVAPDVDAALAAGVRRLVIATTGWASERDRVADALRTARASAVVAPNFSLGVALFARLVEVATTLYGAVGGFEPYLVEWHRRSKADRPSGTALDLADRIVRHHPGLSTTSDLETVSIRAGASPGMHLVGFDSASESVEIRLTARDRAAYATGVLAAADWLLACERPPGLHAFDHVVDELLARPAAAA